MAGSDYTRLAQPIAGDNPAGINLRSDKAHVAAYHAIRDARSAARADDRSSENPYVVDGGASAASDMIQQPSGKWREVHDLAYEALVSQTKDIELLCWLAEAAIRLNGITALADVLASVRALIDADLAALHGSDDETLADKVSPLSGLNGSQDSDGTLIRPLRLVSLAPNQIYGRLSLWDFERARKAKDSIMLSAFQQEFSNVNGEAFSAMRVATEASREHLVAIDKTLTAACGADAPSIGRIREVLDDIKNAYRELSVHVSFPQEAAATAVPAEPGADPAAPKLNGAHAAQGAHAGPIGDREQAFRLLLEVAAFFRRTEPHSTLPLALETLVRRGRMDFIGLLAELVPDENQRREMLTRAGIEPGTANDIR